MSDYGCPYCNYNFKTKREECDLTHEATNGAVMCDFEYEDCPEYNLQNVSSERPTDEELIGETYYADHDGGE